MTKCGLPVANEDLFRQLETTVADLRALDVVVQFSHVPRSVNGVPDRLARAALEGLSPQQAPENYDSYNSVESVVDL